MSEYAVIGLGSFGRAVAEHLTRHGHAVLGIDCDEGTVQSLAPHLDAVVCADATDAEALDGLEVERMTTAVVAIGLESMESSILATALLRQMGVPRIVARSVSELHARVLHAVGAHEVIDPEAEMGERVAYRLAFPRIVERFQVGTGVEVAEIEVPASFVGRSVRDLELRQRHAVSVVAVRRGEEMVAPVPAGREFEAEDVLLVIGRREEVSRLARLA